MKWLAIINPAANHVPLRWFQHLSQRLRAALGAECAWTEYPGHAQEIARNRRGYGGCIGVGGDGTLADVVNGLQFPAQLVGIVPCGTGNGFAHDLGICDVPSALETLLQPCPARFDLIATTFRARGSWHHKYVVSTAAIGYIAGVTALGVGPFKHWGNWRYAAAAVAQLRHQNEFTARVRCHGGEWTEVTLTNLVVNSSRHIGNFLMFPKADLADGLLEVYFGCLSPWRQFADDLAILSRTYLWEGSRRLQARQFEIALDRPALLMLDGELIRDVDCVHFTVSPRRLCCCVPEAYRVPRLDWAAPGVTKSAALSPAVSRSRR
jgi:diacylglycerol kinase family enzyme